jgi:hypothetical protein
MRLDSDERITDELADEIRSIFRPAAERDRVRVPGEAAVLGRELHHGFGRKHYRRSCSVAVQRAIGPADIGPETDGTWLRGRNGYVHLNYNSVDEYLKKRATTGAGRGACRATRQGTAPGRGVP